MGFGVALDDVTDISQLCTRFNRSDTASHAFVGNDRQSPGNQRSFTDEEDFAGIAMEAILDDGDIDIQHITIFQSAIPRDAMTNLMIQ